MNPFYDWLSETIVTDVCDSLFRNSVSIDPYRHEIEVLIAEGIYSYIRVRPDEFLLKSTVIQLILKKIVGKNKKINIFPLINPPVSAMAGWRVYLL